MCILNLFNFTYLLISRFSYFFFFLGIIFYLFSSDKEILDNLINVINIQQIFDRLQFNQSVAIHLSEVFIVS